MIKKVLTLFLFALSLASPCWGDQEKNYCHDSASNLEWERLNREHSDDLAFQAMHGLRIGLCVKVDRGDLTVEQATTIFEAARQNWIESTAERNRRDELMRNSEL